MPAQRRRRETLKAEHYARLLLQTQNSPTIESRIQEFVLTHVITNQKYRGKPTDEPMVPDYVHGALDFIRQAGTTEPAWSDIDTALNKARAALLGTRAERYRIIFPLDLQGSWIHHRQRLLVLGTWLQRTTWDQLRTWSGWEKATPRLEVDLDRLYGLRVDLFFHRFAPLCVNVRGHTLQEAFGRAEEVFQLLRYMLNLAALHRTAWQHQSGRPRPLGFCLPPPVYLVFKAGGDFASMLYSDTVYDYIDKQEISPHCTHWFERGLAQLNRAQEGWCRQFLGDLLRMYGDAMDATDRAGAFLSLWQLLEAATSPERGKVDYQRLHERVLCLLRPAARLSPLLQDALLCLEDTRHALVHRGKFSTGTPTRWDSQDERRVNVLRLVAHHTLTALLPLARRYPDPASLEAYYQWAVTKRRLAELKDGMRSAPCASG